MSPKIIKWDCAEVETPILAWFPFAIPDPVRLKDVPFQLPFCAIATGPGALKLLSQHSGIEELVVSGIFGLAQNVAARNGTPPRSAETICHGGTCSLEGFEINTTPLDSPTLVA